MIAKNEDLHGNVPEKAAVALLLIDVINDLEFLHGPALLEYAVPMAERIAELRAKASKAGVPAIYVNDNFGKWRSDFNQIVQHCLEDGVRGQPLSDILRPSKDDYFILKPKPGFYSTTLDILLEYLGAETLIITGITADICVLFTANDAYLLDFNLTIPSDCVASADPNEYRYALEMMRRVLKADIRPAAELDIDELTRPVTHGEQSLFSLGCSTCNRYGSHAFLISIDCRF